MKHKSTKPALTVILIALFLLAGVMLQAQKNVELKVEVFDRSAPGYTADNNYWTKWVQEQFGKPNNITVKFVPVLRAQEIDKLNILMGSGDAPDIVFTYDLHVAYNYARLGGLTDLSKPLEQYGKNLKKYLGGTVLSLGVFDGVQYSIPAKRVMTGSFGSFIRKDWLDKLKLPVPRTIDEWYNAMKAFKEKDPGNVGKDKVVPFALMTNVSNITWTCQVLLDAFKKKMSYEDESCLPQWIMPGFKDAIRYMNKLYNEGLISPEFPLDKDEKKYDKDVSQGRVGFIIHNVDQPYRTSPGLSMELAKNVPGGELVPCDPFLNAEGRHYRKVYGPNGFYIMIPKTSTHVAEAIKYLDWMANPDTIFFLQNGVKGVNYKEFKSGIPVNIAEVAGDMRITSDIPIIVNGKDFGDLEKNITAGTLGATPGYEKQWADAYRISITGDKYFQIFYPIESEAKLKTTLFDKETEIFVKTVTAKPVDFDKLYDKLVQEYMDAGGTKVLADRKAYFKANQLK
jgi:putative aldouronate transport system substrate-binding protein